MKKDQIILAVIIIIILCLGGCYGFNYYQKKQTEQFNNEYQTRIATQLANSKTLEDSLDILKTELVIIAIPPQSDKLYPEIKEFVQSTHQKLTDKKKDLLDWNAAVQGDSINGYMAYIMAHPDGQFVQQANKRIQEIQQEMIAQAARDLEEERERREMEEERPVTTSYPNTSPRRSTVSDGRERTLELKKLICHKQKAYWGVDEITVMVDGETFFSAEPMRTGQTLFLSSIDPYQLTPDTYIPISIKEVDPKGVFPDVLVIGFQIRGNNYTSGQYEQSSSGARGSYTLVYEIR